MKRILNQLFLLVVVQRIALTLAIIYFAIATYGGSYYIGPALVCALSFWLYQDLKYAKSEISPASELDEDE